MKLDPRHLIAGLAIVAAGVYYMSTRTPLGIRNNNPGNIRRTTDQWQGMDLSYYGDFVRFESPEYGYRAMAKLLRNYHARGLVTIQQIINTWAPSSENDTSSYIEHVASFLQTSPAEELNLDDPIVLGDLIEVIARHENGSAAWEANHNRQMIEQGIALA